MSSENNNDISKEKQQEVEAKENEIEDALDLSDKMKAETKKRAEQIGDDHE